MRYYTFNQSLNKFYNSNNPTIGQTTERAAINMPIQGTAADTMKIAIIQVHKRMKQDKVRLLMLLQIHDELVFEVPNDEIELMKTLVVETMQNALALGNVPILVESRYREKLGLSSLRDYQLQCHKQ